MASRASSEFIFAARPERLLSWGCVYLKRRISFAPMNEVILRRFEAPDEVRTFEKGRFEIVELGGVTIGRATYQPGWR